MTASIPPAPASLTSVLMALEHSHAMHASRVYRSQQAGGSELDEFHSGAASGLVEAINIVRVHLGLPLLVGHPPIVDAPAIDRLPGTFPA